MSWLPVLSVLVPLTTAVLGLAASGSARVQRGLTLFGSTVFLAVALALLSAVWQHGPVAAQMGDWAAPFGITLIADTLSAAMVLITAITGLACAVYAAGDIDDGRRRQGFYPMLQFLLAGVSGAFVTGDVFNLYVWFEVMLISSFALMSLGAGRRQIDGAVKYVALNLVSTLLFLAAIGLLYGMTGTLNFADLHGAVQEVDNPGLLAAVAVMFLVAFGIKSAVFPLFFWLPASYHTPPMAIAAVFSGLLTKVGVYALIRIFTIVFTDEALGDHFAYVQGLLLWIAGLTMVTGVLGAACQSDIRRILSFHIISQIGYMVMGLALYTTLGLVGAVFYLLHHIVVKANLFLVAGVIERLTGSFELKRIGGLYAVSPLLAVLFLIPAFSLAGFPPLSGFWAKFVLVRAGLEVESWWIVAAALVVGLLTIFSMTKIWGEAFWKPHPGGTAALSLPAGRRAGVAVGPLVAPIAALALITITIGLFAQPLYLLAERAAAELLDPTAYITAVFGSLPVEPAVVEPTPAAEAP